MTFLSPGYLAGLLFALLPILLHFFHRRRQRTVLFSDLRFLRQAERQRSRRFRIRELLLLLVRIMIIALLALAFARPVVKTSLPSSLGGAVSGKTTLAIVLDNSYSMGAKPSGKISLWDEARRRALEAVERLHPGDEVMIILASDHPAVLTFEPLRDLERARTMIQEATLSDRGTALASSIAKAYDLLTQTKSPSKSILVLSDFQRVGLSFFGTLPSGNDVALSLALLPGYDRRMPNTAITEAKPQSRLLAEGKEVDVEVQCKRFHDPQGNLPVSLWLDGRKAQETGTSFDPGDSDRTARASLRFKIASSGLHEAVVAAEPDLLTRDDQRYLVLNVPEPVSVLVLGDQSGPGTSAFYLTKALAPGPGAPFMVKTISPQDLSGVDIKRFGAIILSDVALFTEGQLSRLEGFAREGGGLLFIPGPHTDPGYYTKSVLPRLLPMTLEALLQAPEGSSFSIAQFDQEHPALSLFSSKSKGDLSQGKFFQINPCRPGQGTVTLAKLTNGGPAILEKPLGKGKVMAFSFGLEPQATDLPLKAVFVPLMHQILLYLSTQPGPLDTDYHVGQDVERAVPSSGGSAPQALTLLGPDSSRTYLEPKVLGGQSWVSIPNADRAGIYHILSGEKVLDAFAVNLDTRESDLNRMSELELMKFFPQARIVRPEKDLDILEAQVGGVREIWKLLIVLVLLLAVAEMLLREKPRKKEVGG